MDQTSTILIAGAAICSMILVALCAYRLRFAFVALTGMLFMASIAQPTDWLGRMVPTWLSPLQLRRTEAYAACGALIGVACLIHAGKMTGYRRSIQGWLLLVIAVYAGLIRIVGGSPLDGGLSLAFALLSVLPLIIALPAMLKEDDDWFQLIRAFGWTYVLWIGAVAVQFAIRRAPLNLGGTFGSRFNGIINNPQSAGIVLAIGVVLCLFLVLEDPKARFKPLWMATTSVCFVLMLWTLSRTALAMAVIGSTAILYKRLGRAILWLPLLAGLGAVALSLIQGSGIEFEFERFTAGGDTRSGAWMSLIEVAMENPIIGVAGDGAETYSENSLLYGAAQYGIGMVALMLIFMMASGLQMLRLFRVKNSFSPTKTRFAELALAYNAMFFAGSVMEGYIVARVSCTIVVMLAMCAITARLLQEFDAQSWDDQPTYDDSLLEEHLAETYSDTDHAA